MRLRETKPLPSAPPTRLRSLIGYDPSLMARLPSVPSGPERPGLVVGPCRLEPRTRVLSGRAGEARLSPIGCRFLEALAAADGEVVGRRDLIERLWAGNHLVGDPALNRLASEVRRAAAAAAGGEPVVETVHARGYRLAASVPAAAAPSSPAATGAAWLRPLLTTAAVLAALVLTVFVLLLANGLVWGLADPD
jgi:DNA-binding winged helix-turn-helix (wHTH) protein